MYTVKVLLITAHGASDFENANIHVLHKFVNMCTHTNMYIHTIIFWRCHCDKSCICHCDLFGFFFVQKQCRWLCLPRSLAYSEVRDG